MLDLYVDADGCPVKDEVYKVAGRLGLTVFVVCNRPIRVPEAPNVRRVVVGNAFDEADDWIAQKIGEDDVAVTSDLLLAKRCIDAGAAVLTPKGMEYDAHNIGPALSMRALLDELRQMGEATGGPAPMAPRDRSAFLSALHELIVRIRRSYPEDAPA